MLFESYACLIGRGVESLQNSNSLELENNVVTKSENNYLEFINTFTNFTSKYFSTYTHRNSSQSEKFLAEEQITQSLLLIEKLHMNLVYRNSLYKNFISMFDTTHIFSLQSHTNYQLFKRLQGLINEYHFQNEKTKTLCTTIISQIMTYYPENSIEFIIMTPPSPPWQPRRYDIQLD